jgi:hypothetical protein
MRFYLDHAPGGVARLFKRLPFKLLSGAITRETRMGFLIQRKQQRWEPGEAIQNSKGICDGPFGRPDV